MKKYSTHQCFYIPLMLFDSVYRKNGNYYPEMLLEKFGQSFFWRRIINFGFWGFGNTFWNIRKFRFLKYNFLTFFRVFVFWNIRKAFFWKNIGRCFGVFISWNINKAFFSGNIRNFIMLEILEIILEIFWKYKKFFRVSVSWNISNF